MMCAIALLLSGCVIVRHDAQDGESNLRTPDSLANRSYNSEAFAEEVWQAELMPYIKENAVDMKTLLDALELDADKARADYGSRSKGALNAEAFVVKGTATIVEVRNDTSSGTLVLDIDSDGAADCAVQIGPVIKTTALRDCAPFIKFDMFADQMEFAGVNRALNAIVMRDVVGDADFSAWTGKTLSFMGAFNDSESVNGPMMIIPVVLDAT